MPDASGSQDTNPQPNCAGRAREARGRPAKKERWLQAGPWAHTPQWRVLSRPIVDPWLRCRLDNRVGPTPTICCTSR